ncbi:HNH endonuclease [Turicibacter sp. TS3]|uniref:HNH endonuclease n=1 Tax=Turicibacter sp. TS3 TaxID=2304578 RepID=UPI00137AB7AE|nr:HNH endonuclease [Turicibacter sp. TS3]NCE79366.1 hypothetical protein [Turicibacter sp. TS3]
MKDNLVYLDEIKEEDVLYIEGIQKVYGERFAGKIEVHHKKPLKEIGETYQVDPIHELIPVCPNCHMILHLGDPVFTPEEVEAFINSVRSKIEDPC